MPSNNRHLDHGSSSRGAATATAERGSSIRMCKQSGGASTMGSILFGGPSGADTAAAEERTARRLFPQSAAPEESALPTRKAAAAAADTSLYGAPTSAQRERERVAVSPGAVALEDLRELQQQHGCAPLRRHLGRNPILDAGSNNLGGDQQPPQQLVARRVSTSDYFANGLGGVDAGGQQRRTRRMVAGPGAASGLQLG